MDCPRCGTPMEGGICPECGFPVIRIVKDEGIRDHKTNHESEKIRKQYADEVRDRWGDTDAYKESERRTARYSHSDWSELSAGIEAIMEGFAELNNEGAAPDAEPARSQVEKLKQFITDRMYTSTDEILSGLGQMYVADDRFTNNIDRHGEGTAVYVSECIKSYCSYTVGYST